jgi:hypothetical protein
MDYNLRLLEAFAAAVTWNQRYLLFLGFAKRLTRNDI